MPVNGNTNNIPKSGGKPTGIFSTRGSQKQDGPSGPHMGTLQYAHSRNTRKAVPVASSNTKRHQPPKG